MLHANANSGGVCEGTDEDWIAHPQSKSTICSEPNMS